MRIDPWLRAAIAAIGEGAWTPIRYPCAIFDDQLGCWVSDAQAAEVEYTAFTSRKGKAINVAARAARHGRGHITLHLPEGWHRQHEWASLSGAACGPPAAAA